MASRRFATLAVTLTAAVLAAGCDENPTQPDMAGPPRAFVSGGTSGTVRISEIHYDNVGTDEGEAIEIAGPAGTDLTGWRVVLYNGSNGTAYNTRTLSGTIPATCDAEGVVVLEYPVNGIQNGSPDGVALVDATGAVVEFLSYEGTFTAVDGPAAGLTSTDIGVEEGSSTPVGHSLQRDGAGVWSGPAANTFGACNAPGGGNGGEHTQVFLSELHYDNEGADVGEGFEVSGPAGTDLAGWSVVLYNGSNGAVYATIALSGVIPETCREKGGLYFPHEGIQNGSPDGLALVDPTGAVVEFLSYEGTFTATNGPAAGMTSVDIGVAETGSTPVGYSLQRDAADGAWYGPAPSTFGCGDDGGSGGDIGPVFLSEIRADQPGTDTDEYFEVGGAPGTSLDGITLIVIGDGAGGNGVIEHVTTLTGRVLNAQGAFVAAEATFTLGTADLVTNLNFENGGNQTYMLVRGFTGANGQDLDTDDDGTLDAMPWSEVLDCVALIEFLGAQPVYCDARVIGDGFTPGHVVRTDTGWISANFTPGPGDTPGTLAFDPATAVAGQIAPWGVGAPGVPTTITVNASFVPLPVGYNRALFVSVLDDFRDPVPGVEVTFTSADPAVVTVDAFGNLHATGVGTATVTIAAVGTSLTRNVTVAVEPDVPSGVVFQNHLEFGTPTDADPSDDILIIRDEYALSYNPNRGGANWVSWNLDASHIGSVDRCECYTPDPLLPPGVYRVVNFDYTGSGYSRGHMTQSFNRTATLADNATTYLMTNILPQAAANNTGPWASFETYTTDRALAGEEVYIIAGGQYSPNPPTLKNEGKVAIPDYTWKVAVFLDRDKGLADVSSISDIEVIAIRTPNRIEPGVPGSVVDEITTNDWRAYVVTVDEIEAAIGYDLLALLPDDIESLVESGFPAFATLFDDAVASGAVGAGASAALGAHLRGAEQQLVRGRRALAVRQIEIFVRLLNVFENNGKVTPAAAAALRAEAGRLTRVLGGV